MNVKIEKAGAWLGLVSLGLIGVFFFAVAGFVPPPRPQWDADQIAQLYTDRNLRIRIGLAGLMFFGWLFTPFWALIAIKVRRIEGHWGVLSISEVIIAVTFPFGLSIVSWVGLVAAYRPERSPEITQALNDLFWFMFIGMIGPTFFAVLIFGIAVFMDKRQVPSFPRWYGYLCMWFCLLSVGEAALFLFKSGPLAWDGLISFWIPMGVNGIFFPATVFVLLKAVDVDAAEREQRFAQQEREPVA